MEKAVNNQEGSQNTFGESSLASSQTKLELLKNIIKRSGIFWALIVLCIIASLISPHFFKVTNLINVIRQISISGVVSIGMTFVILTGGIDLSVGSMLGVVAVTCATMLKSGIPVSVVVVTGLLLGLALGAINGLGITVGRIVPFIMTLGTLVAVRGLAMIIANGQPIPWNRTGPAFDWLGGQSMLGIPVSVWLFALVFLVAAAILKYTPFGRYIYAVGDCREAARLSGINVKLIEFSAYAISGLLAGLSSLVYISRLSVGEPTAGTGLELDAIAMVFIGGASTSGGQGKVTGTLIGAAIVAVIANLLNLLGISPFIQQIVKGLIIVLAVLLERRKKN